MLNPGFVAILVAGGLGALVFLKIVCDEVIVKHRVLELRLEVKAERAAEQARADAAQKVTTAEEADEITTIEAA